MSMRIIVFEMNAIRALSLKLETFPFRAMWIAKTMTGLCGFIVSLGHLP